MGRRLGQHFLRPASVQRLLATLAPAADEDFLEIGPGAGALTLPLAARARSVVCVELDERLAGELRERAPSNVRVVVGDALEVDLESLLTGPRVRLAGNLPYAVSSPLLRRLLALRARAPDLHVMLQREVAERIAAAPGSKQYGVLSVIFALWADVDLPLRFPPGAFQPAPRVESALLRARFRSAPREEVPDASAFEALVRQAFAHRRKTLENNLRDSYPNLKDHLRLANISGSRRSETLSVVEFARLARSLA